MVDCVRTRSLFYTSMSVSVHQQYARNTCAHICVVYVFIFLRGVIHEDMKVQSFMFCFMAALYNRRCKKLYLKLYHNCNRTWNGSWAVQCSGGYIAAFKAPFSLI